MIYRVIIRSGNVDLWFDFVEYGQAAVFAEAAKLQNVPNNPRAYADTVDKVSMEILTLEEQRSQMNGFERNREDVSQYAE